MIIKTKNFSLALNTYGDPKASKLAIILPGRLDTKDYNHIKSHMQTAAKKGYFAVSFDPPGTWESGDDPNAFSFTNYCQALNDVINYFGNRETLLIGHSMGGAVAIEVSKNNQFIEALILIMTKNTKYVTPGKSNMTSSNPYVSKRSMPDNDGTKEFIVPAQFFLEMAAIDLNIGIDNLLMPKLVIGGLKDQVVKKELLDEIYGLMPNPKQLFMIDTIHDYRTDQKALDKINERIENFIGENYD